MPWQFGLRLDPADITAVAERFGDLALDEAIEREVVPAARTQGYLTKPQFLRLCEWKSPRPRRYYQRNDPTAIEEATREALLTSDERRRVAALDELSGVGYPVASVLLHWIHPDPYPILDYRAIRSVGIDEPPNGGSYSFEFWCDYTGFCRDLARRYGVSMRVLDRALWQFDYERYPRGG